MKIVKYVLLIATISLIVPLAYANTDINQTWQNHSARTAKDDIPPASVTNLKNITYKPNYINWTWKDPSDNDFTKVMVYISGIFKTNVSKGRQFYNLTGLIPNTIYKISTHTVDTSGNINQTWINKTARTAKDSIPSKSITNLKNMTYKPNYINWTWKDPSDYDFAKVMVYINGRFKTNVSKGRQFYNATGLIANTSNKISTHTVDTSGNVNNTWVNKTARTALSIANVAISSLSYHPQIINVTLGTKVIWTNMDAVGHTVTSNTGLFDSGVISQDGKFSYTFNINGSYGYHCEIHDFMKGEVIVK